MKIKDVVGDKPTQGVITITPEATVRDLLGLLAELAYAVGFALLARWLYRAGLRRYGAYGG